MKVRRRAVAPEPAEPILPPALADHASAVWRQPALFSAWCAFHLPAGDVPAPGAMFGPNHWWGERFDYARTRWAARYGCVRGEGGRVLDVRRLDALGCVMSGSLNRAADRAGVDLPLKRAGMAVTEADRVEARTGRRPAG